MKKVTIITPCRNAERYIIETMESILSQTAFLSGRAELEYIICDGLSSDRTVEIAEGSTAGFRHGTVRIVSQQDRGMYDALSNGLRLATGDICAYLNAGDFYERHALDVVLDLFEARNVEWITGFAAEYNDRSQLVWFSLPFRYRRRFFAWGCYGGLFPAVQQESTFWSSRLNEVIDLEELAQRRLAGDFYLWHQFAQVTELKIVMAYLGGFRRHEGQLSRNMATYRQEIREIVGHRKPGLTDIPLVFLDGLMWMSPPFVKKICNPGGLFSYDHKRREWI
jgi:Glycosyl transferase family 2